MTAFSTLTQLPTNQLDNLREMGFDATTPIQAASLPAILSGRDVRAPPQTGSGKTAAFGIGVLNRINSGVFIRRRWCCARRTSWPTKSATCCVSWRALPATLRS